MEKNALQFGNMSKLEENALQIGNMKKCDILEKKSFRGKLQIIRNGLPIVNDNMTDYNEAQNT